MLDGKTQILHFTCHFLLSDIYDIFFKLIFPVFWDDFLTRWTVMIFSNAASCKGTSHQTTSDIYIKDRQELRRALILIFSANLPLHGYHNISKRHAKHHITAIASHFCYGIVSYQCSFCNYSAKKWCQSMKFI